MNPAIRNPVPISRNEASGTRRNQSRWVVLYIPTKQTWTNKTRSWNTSGSFVRGTEYGSARIKRRRLVRCVAARDERDMSRSGRNIPISSWSWSARPLALLPPITLRPRPLITSVKVTRFSPASQRWQIAENRRWMLRRIRVTFRFLIKLLRIKLRRIPTLHTLDFQPCTRWISNPAHFSNHTWPCGWMRGDASKSNADFGWAHSNQSKKEKIFGRPNTSCCEVRQQPSVASQSCALANVDVLYARNFSVYFCRSVWTSQQNHFLKSSGSAFMLSLKASLLMNPRTSSTTPVTLWQSSLSTWNRQRQS